MSPLGCSRNEDDRQTSSRSRSDLKDHNSQNERQSTKSTNDDRPPPRFRASLWVVCQPCYRPSFVPRPPKPSRSNSASSGRTPPLVKTSRSCVVSTSTWQLPSPHNRSRPSQPVPSFVAHLSSHRLFRATRCGLVSRNAYLRGRLSPSTRSRTPIVAPISPPS